MAPLISIILISFSLIFLSKLTLLILNNSEYLLLVYNLFGLTVIVLLISVTFGGKYTPTFDTYKL